MIELPARYSQLSPKQRREVREAYASLQEGKCYYCTEPLNQAPPTRITNKRINWKLFPKGFLNYPVHLQHNHDTDITEGAVHAYCNAVMWQYEHK